MSTNDRSRPDDFHIYVRHDGAPYFLADDGTFVAELDKAHAYASWDAAIDALNALIGGRELGRDEPGIIVNAWKWIRT